MGAIRIPSIRVSLPIAHGTDAAALANGAGHLYGSSLPVPGNVTPVVIAAHRGYEGRDMFLRLDRLKTGDRAYVDAGGQTMEYAVTGRRILAPTDTRWVYGARPGTLTLLTCTPVGINTQRLAIDLKLTRVAAHAAPPARPGMGIASGLWLALPPLALAAFPLLVLRATRGMKRAKEERR